jgi:hypothetical protein
MLANSFFLFVLLHSIYLVDTQNNRLYLEKIDGLTMKEFLWSGKHCKNRLKYLFWFMPIIMIIFVKLHEINKLQK